VISLDWKERLIKDAEEFFKINLPKQNYRFDVIYNAYPVRDANNDIPNEVLTLVAKELAVYIEKEHELHQDFLNYLWHEGQDNGKFILCIIINKIYAKDKARYFAKMKEFINDAKDERDKALLVDKIFFPLLKKYPDKYLATAYKWISEDDLELQLIIFKTLTKFIKSRPEYAKPVLRHLENRWINATPEMIKSLSLFFKEIAKIDKELYLDTFDFYDNSRDPDIIEILTGSISFYDKNIDKIVEEWTKSGNARLKKCAVTAYKNLLRLKNKGKK